VATHLNHLVVTHASELLGRREIQALIERMQKDTPSLVDDLIPKALSLTTLQKVLQNLLEEGVPIRDMRTILEALAEHTPKVSDPHELTAVVRLALGRAITQQWFPGIGDMQVKVQARVILRRRLAKLQRDRRPGPVRRHEHLRPSAESILAQCVAQSR